MNSHKHLSILLAALAGVGLCLSCGGGEEGGGNGGGDGGAQVQVPDPPEVSDEAMAAAREKFNTLCATCHGKNGKGEGDLAKTLNPKPRDYTDAEWQATVTNEQLAETIVKGGQAMGLSPVMPASQDLKDKPEVVDGLVAIIRGFAKQ